MLKKLRFKYERVQNLTKLVGFLSALAFEVAWTMRRPEIMIALPGLNGPLVVRRYSSDIHVFSSIFFERELEVFLPEDPRFIIDGGANVGYSTAFFACRFPGSTVIAVEPAKANLTQLRRNCARYNNVVCLEGALWPVSTTLRFVDDNAEAWSFRVEEGHDSGSVQTYTIDEIMETYSIEFIDLMKLDIEGAEQDLFESNYERWLPKVKAILVEIHGEQARAAIERACAAGAQFDETSSGEKLLLVRRS